MRANSENKHFNESEEGGIGQRVIPTTDDDEVIFHKEKQADQSSGFPQLLQNLQK